MVVSRLDTNFDSCINLELRIATILYGEGKFSVVGILIKYIDNPIETDYNIL